MSQPSVGRPDDAPEPLATDVELVWPEDIGDNPLPVNQVIVANDQQFSDVVYLYLGHVAPPPWLTQQAAQERLQELDNHLPIRAQGSFVLSRGRAEEFWEALGRHIGRLPRP